MEIVYIAIGCGLLALLYGLVTARQVLAASPGNATMQAIAGAIQEGAKAYLVRQYSTIALVGIVVAVLVGLFLGLTSAVGFLIGHGEMSSLHRQSQLHRPSALQCMFVE